jgi:hypothetical protein
MEREIETKFDLPLDLPEEDVLCSLLEAAAATGCGFNMESPITRNFQYYDTGRLDVYLQGHTVRRVGGFSPQHKGAFRYDFKVGTIVDRYEAKHWSNNILTPEEIIEQFNLQRFYSRLEESAYADTKHEKMKIERDGIVIEATIDLFDVKHGSKFRELELELQEGGSMELLKDISVRVQQALCLRPLSLQKYSRVIQGMLQYKDIILSGAL